MNDHVMSDERFRELRIIWVARYRYMCDRPVSEEQWRIVKENEGYDIFSELLDEVRRLRKENADLAQQRDELQHVKKAIMVFDNLIDCPLEDGCLYDTYPKVSCGTCLCEHWDVHNQAYDYE